MLIEVMTKSVTAGLLASLACGLGALPLLIRSIDPIRHTGIGYAFAGGLMFSASVYNLILPGLIDQDLTMALPKVLPVLIGILLGASFLSGSHWVTYKNHSLEESTREKNRRTFILIFLAMTIHSFPEGVAVGVGYVSGEINANATGSYLAMAIAIHNIPEGLAVAIPLRATGASINKCFWAAVLTSLPQPIAAIPAVLASWFFQPLIALMMGFAAGAMIFLVLLELIPQALDTATPTKIAWAFTLGFCLMLLIQVIL
jgi:ZIP family zinc transporter